MNSPLTSTATLAAHLDDPDWIIVDVRFDLTNPNWGRQAYAASHIPAAQFMDLNDDLAGKKTGRNGRHPLPDPAAFAAKLGAMGIDRSKHVVVYDQGTTMFVGRLWWMLRWLGHEAVTVLDGGYAAWEKELRVISSAIPKPIPTEFVSHIQTQMQISSDAIVSGLAQRAHAIVDARSNERFTGAVEPIDPVGGHIPGAVNRPFPQNLGADGKFLPAAQLRAQFDAFLGAKRGAEIIHSCGSGVSSLSNMLAMEHAGITGSRLYVGSWSEWSSDASRAVAKG